MHSDMMPSLDIRCKCCLYGHCCGKQKGTVSEWTNEGVCVGCQKIVYHGLMSEKNRYKILSIFI